MAVPQWKRLLEHFRNPFKRTITRLDAWQELGISELSRAVIDLEGRGFSVEKTPVHVLNRYGEKIKVTRYSLAHDPERTAPATLF